MTAGPVIHSSRRRPIAAEPLGAQDPAVDLPPLVLRRDLTARGYTDRESRLTLAGLRRLAPGSYARADGLALEQMHILRTQAVVGRLRHVAASHVSAAVLWGLPMLAEHLARVHISPTQDRRGRPKSRDSYRMHSRAVAQTRLREVLTVPVSEPVLTVLDCARWLDLDWAVAVADAALHSNLLTTDDLVDAAQDLPRQPGVQRARHLPGLVSPLAESPGESLLRQRLVRMGFAIREQVAIGSARVDLVAEGGVIVEFDGRGKYQLRGDPEQAHWAEKRRHDALVDRGYEVVHVCWADLWDERTLEQRIRTALRRWQRRAGVD